MSETVGGLFNPSIWAQTDPVASIGMDPSRVRFQPAVPGYLGAYTLEDNFTMGPPLKKDTINLFGDKGRTRPVLSHEARHRAMYFDPTLDPFYMLNEGAEAAEEGYKPLDVWAKAYAPSGLTTITPFDDEDLVRILTRLSQNTEESQDWLLKKKFGKDSYGMMNDPVVGGIVNLINKRAQDVVLDREGKYMFQGYTVKYPEEQELLKQIYEGSKSNYKKHRPLKLK